MATFSQKASAIKREWYLIDATNQTLGRLATVIARHLNGKNKPEYSPNLDTGDYIVVINAEKIKVTGAKLSDKLYQHHSGYQGGIKTISLGDLLVKDPASVIESAVKGMLPKGVLGRAMSGKLKVYAGDKHPHEAQKLKQLAI